jgi:hypothetical protein
MKHRVTRSFVVAVIAIFFVCAGGATASKLITGKGIKDGSITGADIKRASIGPSKLSDGILNDIQAAKERPMAPGPAGPAGLAGPAGPQGAQGPAGPSNTSAINMVTGHTSVSADDIGGGVVACPAGQNVIAGGYFSDSGYAFSDHPTPDRTGWSIGIDNTGATVTADVDAYALCAGSGQAVAASLRSNRMVAPTGKLAREIAQRARQR